MYGSHFAWSSRDAHARRLLTRAWMTSSRARVACMHCKVNEGEGRQECAASISPVYPFLLCGCELAIHLLWCKSKRLYFSISLNRNRCTAVLLLSYFHHFFWHQA